MYKAKSCLAQSLP